MKLHIVSIEENFVCYEWEGDCFYKNVLSGYVLMYICDPYNQPSHGSTVSARMVFSCTCMVRKEHDILTRYVINISQ